MDSFDKQILRSFKEWRVVRVQVDSVAGKVFSQNLDASLSKTAASGIDRSG